MRAIIRTVLLGLSLQLLLSGPAAAADEELFAFLPETLAGMTRVDLRSDNTDTRKAIALYDANGDGAEDVELILVDLGDYADAIRFYQEVNVAEGRQAVIDIAGRTVAETENGRSPYLLDIVVGRIWVGVEVWWKAEGVENETLRQALSGLDFAAMEAYAAPELTPGGRPGPPTPSLPLTPSFLLPSSLAGLGRNTQFGYRARFNQFGGPTVEGNHYDGNVEGGPAVIASLWDFGRYGEEAERLIAERATTENWEPITHRGYPGYVVDGAEPRVYLSVGRLRLRLESENGGPDAAGLQAALDGVDLDRLIRFGTITRAPVVKHDPETEDAVPANPDALANALPESVAGFNRVDHSVNYQKAQIREVTQRMATVEAVYEGANGLEMRVIAFAAGVALFADTAWMEQSNMALTEVRRGEQTIRIIRRGGKTNAFLDVDGRIGLILIPGSDMTEDMLFDIVADFGLDRLAALISGEATGSGAIATSCTDQDCFEAAFAACTPASYRTPEMFGARARYEVIGPAEGGCRVSLVFESNPNPQWVGKALQMNLAPGAPFIESFQSGMQACMSRKAEATCDGALMSLIGGE